MSGFYFVGISVLLRLISFFIVFYLLLKNSITSSSVAFKMISIWLMFCVLIPGSVHQYASFKYPVNYMTDFLDVNRKQTYEVFDLDNLDIYNILIEIHPHLIETKKSQDTVLDNQVIMRSISTIVHQMNLNAANQIELQNEEKNHIIRLSYYFNPVTLVQNLWNSCTSTDYNAYKNFRIKINEAISQRNNLIVSQLWKDSKVDKEAYMEFLKVLKN